VLASPVLAAAFALSAAAAWGAGDFANGLAARRVGAFRAVLGSYTVGLFALAIVALARGERLPPLGSDGRVIRCGRARISDARLF